MGKKSTCFDCGYAFESMKCDGCHQARRVSARLDREAEIESLRAQVAEQQDEAAATMRRWQAQAQGYLAEVAALTEERDRLTQSVLIERADHRARALEYTNGLIARTDEANRWSARWRTERNHSDDLLRQVAVLNEERADALRMARANFNSAEFSGRTRAGIAEAEVTRLKLERDSACRDWAHDRAEVTRLRAALERIATGVKNMADGFDHHGEGPYIGEDEWRCERGLEMDCLKCAMLDVVEIASLAPEGKAK